MEVSHFAQFERKNSRRIEGRKEGRKGERERAVELASCDQFSHLNHARRSKGNSGSISDFVNHLELYLLPRTSRSQVNDHSQAILLSRWRYVFLLLTLVATQNLPGLLSQVK